MIDTADKPAFKEPISADLPRRQLDRKILESYDATQERIRNISSRVTRMEAIFESVKRDLSRLEETQKEMSGHLETTATNMAAISNKLSVHTEMEEYQWQIVNKSNTHLEQLSTAFNDHLTATSCFAARVDWLERILFGLCGAIGTLLLTWITTRMVGA